MTAVGFAIGAAFLASCVEFVEAFTVILAVGITRNWRSSLLGAAAAAVALAAIIGLFGVTLVRYVPIDILRGVIGTLVLVFGLKWLRKCILRFAGVKGMHDEGEIFEEESAKLRAEGGAVQPMDWLGFTISFKSTLLEGLEVAFIVLTFGLSSGNMALPIVGAAAAFVVVGITGLMVRKPLEQVPENTMKWIVGVMLSSFGTFWAGEGLGVNWPAADLSIVGLIAVYVLFSWLAVQWLRSASLQRKQLESAAAA
jgi:uncharacterized membrane protein